MIIHELKTVFIHVPKTGGTSIEFALSKYCLKDHVSIDEQHFKKRKIIKKIGITNWNEYFKFAFVRNPWDRLVSAYYFKVKRTNVTKNLTNFFGSLKEKIIDITNAPPEKFLKKTPSLQMDVFSNFREWAFYVYQKKVNLSQMGFLCDLDFIGRFENLEEDFKIVCKKIDIQELPLEHINASDHCHYSRYYDKKTKEMVGEWFRDEIDRFDYKFEPLFI